MHQKSCTFLMWLQRVRISLAEACWSLSLDLQTIIIAAPTHPRTLSRGHFSPTFPRTNRAPCAFALSLLPNTLPSLFASASSQSISTQFIFLLLLSLFVLAICRESYPRSLFRCDRHHQRTFPSTNHHIRRKFNSTSGICLCHFAHRCQHSIPSDFLRSATYTRTPRL